MELADALGLGYTPTETCYRCGHEIYAWPVGHIQQTAYGWCCDRCLVEMPRADFTALGTMGALADELLARDA